MSRHRRVGQVNAFYAVHRAQGARAAFAASDFRSFTYRKSIKSPWGPRKIIDFVGSGDLEGFINAYLKCAATGEWAK